MKFGLLMAMALGLTISCGETSEQILPEPEVNGVRSEKQRVTSPNIPAGDLDTLIEGNTAFALDLLKQVSPSEDGNLVFSPHSISIALAMTYAGARTTTESAMASTLHFQLGQSSLHPAFNALDQALASRGQGALASDGTPFKLNIANAIWLQDGLSFQMDFLDTLALNYGVGLNLMDFNANAEGSRQEINEWVEIKTEEKIKDLLPEGSITPDTVAVLTNAIYFNASWKDQFPEETASSTFTLTDGTEISVPMMEHLVGYNHIERADFHALEMPYDGEEVSMVILLPKTGTVNDLELALTATELDAALSGLEAKMVQLAFPKFKFETPLPLSEHLKAMGMEVAFSGAADFSGMIDGGGLAITDVLHKAMIDVNEKGTEAAAATAVIVGETSVPQADIDLRVDRPFLFFIRDIETGAILFAGRVVDPR